MNRSVMYEHGIPPEILAVGGPPPRVEDCKFWLYGMESSANHIRDWRRMRFLLVAEEALSATREEAPHLDEIIDLRIGSGRAAGRASVFIPGEGFHRFSEPVQHISRLIGTKSFQAVYNASPPPELVNYVISPENQKRYPSPDYGPYLEQVTIEVLHGRVKWEDRFAAAGVPTPEDYIETATESYRGTFDHFEG